MQQNGAVDEVYLAHCRNVIPELETAFQTLAQAPETGRHAAFRIQQIMATIQTDAPEKNFILAGEVASSLYAFLENDYVEGDVRHVLIIKKHIETLKTLFTHAITGDGGKTGKALKDALGALIKKFEVE